MSFLKRPHTIIKTGIHQFRKISGCGYNEYNKPIFSPFMACLITGSLFSMSLSSRMYDIRDELQRKINNLELDIQINKNTLNDINLKLSEIEKYIKSK